MPGYIGDPPGRRPLSPLNNAAGRIQRNQEEQKRQNEKARAKFEADAKALIAKKESEAKKPAPVKSKKAE